MCARVCSDGPAQADLAPPLDDADHHDVCDADAAYQQRHGTQTQEQPGEGALGSRSCLQQVRRPADLDFFWILGIDCSGQHVPSRVDVVFVDTHIDDRRRKLDVVVGLRRTVADQDGPVEVRRQRERFENSEDFDPASAEVELNRSVEIANPQALCRYCADDGHRMRPRGFSKECTVCDAAVQRAHQPRIGREHADPARAILGHEVVAVDPDADAVHGCGGLDGRDPSDGCDGCAGQRRIASTEP